ncbi:MAG: carbohydrate ABC transporter permease [Saccharofermentanales bacterium]
MKNARKNISGMQRSRRKWAFLFTLPWLIGAVNFFVVPMIQSGVYAFSKVTLTAAGEKFDPVGFANFSYLFTQDPNFLTNLSTSILKTIYQVPVIVIFALFSALLIHKKFVGQTFVRAVFFFPVMIASGVVITILQEQLMMTAQSAGEEQSYLFSAPSFIYLIEQLRVPSGIIDLVRRVISNFFDIIWKSGVQIIILLASVNHIPESSYEAADIEGASAWEKLWSVTIPMISPSLLIVLIYSLIDSFTDYSNLIIRMVTSYFNAGQYEYSSTIGLVYFVIVLIVVGVVNLVVGRGIQYSVK